VEASDLGRLSSIVRQFHQLTCNRPILSNCIAGRLTSFTICCNTSTSFCYHSAVTGGWISVASKRCRMFLRSDSGVISLRVSCCRNKTAPNGTDALRTNNSVAS
jgi:hypothetical protein